MISTQSWQRFFVGRVVDPPERGIHYLVADQIPCAVSLLTIPLRRMSGYNVAMRGSAWLPPLPDLVACQ